MRKLRTYSNVGKLRLNMALNREFIKNYPVKAYIEPTLFCNLRCPACPTGLQMGLRPSASIDVNLFKKAIDEIGDTCYRYLLLCRQARQSTHQGRSTLIAQYNHPSA